MKIIKQAILVITFFANNHMMIAQNLNSMSVAKRDSILISIAKEVVLKYGPGYYREYKPPVIGKQIRQKDGKSNVYAYMVTFLYDETKETLIEHFAVQITILAETWRPESVMFGNRIGRSIPENLDWRNDISIYPEPYREGVKPIYEPDNPEPINIESLIWGGWKKESDGQWVKSYLIFRPNGGVCGENLTWYFNPETRVLTIKGTGQMTNFSSESPAPWYNANRYDPIQKIEIEDSVTSIGDYAFARCNYFTSITIPNSVTSIGHYAFYECSDLDSVSIGSSVTSIGYHAFYCCYNLTSVVIPNSVTRIGDSAFSNCHALASIIIPNSVTSIGNGAFAHCSNLTSVSISNSVKSIGEYVFSGCSSLASVIIPNSVTTIKFCAFSECTGLTSAMIPNSVTSIGGGAFSRCGGLVSMIIPNSVTSIGNAAFSKCTGLASVSIGNSVTDIENDAFAGCCSLVSVTIPNSVTKISNGVFSECSKLMSINVEESNPFYMSDNGALFNKEKTTLVCMPNGKTGNYAIPNSVTNIEVKAFAGCSGLTSIIIPNSITRIGYGAFEGCSGLASIAIPNGVKDIEFSTFRGCTELASITIPRSVTRIGGYAFEGCRSLASIIIPNKVRIIESFVFADCSSLISAKISKSVTRIDERVFTNCSSLTTIEVKKRNPSYMSENGVLFNKKKTTLVCFPGGKTGSYTIPNSVTIIGKNAFACSRGLTSVSIGNSVNSVGVNAFASCTGLTSVTIPNSVTIIGWGAFSGCFGLTSVSIGNGIATIQDYAFAPCSATQITSGDTVGNTVPPDCAGLTSITVLNPIPAEITGYAFYHKHTCVLKVPAGSVARYQQAEGWKYFGQIVEIVNP